MPAIDWRNLGKRWQTGETDSQENGALQQSQDTRTEIQEGMEKAAAKTVVWNAERKCFAWEFSARATNTLQTFAYETKVFLVCDENNGMEKAIFFSMEYDCAR